MTNTATLTIERAGDLRYLMVDCPHGTTESLVLNAQDGELERETLRMLLQTHDEESHCSCTAELWQRYGGRR